MHLKQTSDGRSFRMSNEEFLTWRRQPVAVRVVSRSGKIVMDITKEQLGRVLEKAHFLLGESLKAEGQFWLARLPR